MKLLNFVSRRHFAVLVLFTFALSLVGYATVKGPDSGGYTATDAAVYSFVDISGTGGGVAVLGGTDDGTTALTMPFQFLFYGKPYSIVCASSNGAIYFVTSLAECTAINDFANTDLSGTTPIGDKPGLFPLWSDLTFQTAGGGAILYKTLGTAGSRRFVVQWNNAYPQGSDNPVTFQVVLTEATNKVLFQYQTVGLGAGNPANNGGQATVGIRNAGAPGNLQQIAWSFNAQVVTNQSAIQITPAVTKVVGDADGDGFVTCIDLSIVRAAYGKAFGQPGYDARADLNGDRVINLTDLTIVSRAVPAGTRCP